MIIWEKIKKIDWMFYKHLGIIGFLGIFWKSEFKLFFLFYLIYIIDPLLKIKKLKTVGKQDDVDLSKYFLGLAFSTFNPYYLWLAGKQSYGHMVIFFRNITGLPQKENYRNSVEYNLPFHGEWSVANGGSTKENSHSWQILTQRYALDFVIENESNVTHQGDGMNLGDYFCFEKDVISPADGVVVQVSNKIKDYEGVGDYSIDWKVRDFRGNFVVTQHSKKEYSFIAHFKHNTIRVKKGEKVKQGQLIGQCGNSGHSTEPHIHFHLQDNRIFWVATGLPIRFKRFSAKSQNKNATIRINDFAEKNEIVSNTLSE